MKKVVCIVFTLIMLFSFVPNNVFATEYSGFDIVFEEKESEKVNDTAIRIFASVEDGALVERTDDFTMEDVAWFKYLPETEEGKTSEDYDYVDEELNIYGMLCNDEDVFEHDHYSYFLRIARLYAQEEDIFYRNVKINGVDVDELNGSCYSTGNEFYIKTITNGFGGSSDESDVISETAAPDGDDSESTPVTKESVKDKCKVCGICPIQPLGICLFIWIAVILIVVILVVVLVLKGKNKKQKEKE